MVPSLLWFIRFAVPVVDPLAWPRGLGCRKAGVTGALRAIVVSKTEEEN